MANPSPLSWKVEPLPGASKATFAIAGSEGLLTPGCLREIGLPHEVEGRENGGLVFSGRGPIWLYAHLVHLAHPFAWVAVHDPRLAGAVVISRHVPDAPPLGAVIPL